MLEHCQTAAPIFFDMGFFVHDRPDTYVSITHDLSLLDTFVTILTDTFVTIKIYLSIMDTFVTFLCLISVAGVNNF